MSCLKACNSQNNKNEHHYNDNEKDTETTYYMIAVCPQDSSKYHNVFLNSIFKIILLVGSTEQLFLVPALPPSEATLGSSMGAQSHMDSSCL